MIALLLLENEPVELPGAMAHDRTFPGALRRTVPGAHGDVVVGPAFPQVEPAYVETARAAAAEGASLITANCGFAIAYQDAVARQGCPTALSSLLLLPLLWRVFGGRVGVLTYDASQLDHDRRRATHWPSDEVPVAGVRSLPAWVPLADTEQALEPQRMEAELLAVAERFVRSRNLRALLLECTAMFPFAASLRERLGVATFDLNAFVHYLAAQLATRP